MISIYKCSCGNCLETDVPLTPGQACSICHKPFGKPTEEFGFRETTPRKTETPETLAAAQDSDNAPKNEEAAA
jgi:hypothetical protein